VTRPPVIPSHTACFYRPGERCADSQPGDLVLVRHEDFVARSIRFFQSIRRPRDGNPNWEQACWTNHAAVVVEGGPDAIISQEAGGGDVETPLANFDDLTYAVVNIEMTGAQRASVVNFARWVVGSGYGFLTIPADAFNALTGLELTFGVSDRMACSTQAARALERSDIIFDRSPWAMTPAHLALHFGVFADAAGDEERLAPRRSTAVDRGGKRS